MFHVWTLLPAVYVCWRFIKLLTISFKAKLLLGVVALTACEYHLLSRMIFGTMFSPELPEPVMLMLGWGFGSVIFLALMLLLQDILLVISGKFFGRPLSGRNSVRMAMLCISTVLSAVGVYNAVQVPEVHRLEIRLKKLPREFDGFTVVQLTDIHTSRLLTGRWVQEVVDKTDALHPDLIVVTGDMADGTVSARKADVSPLASLKAPYGIYAVTGNHEYYFNADAWIKEYSRLGFRFLMNNQVRLTKDDATIVLAGVNDDIGSQYGGTGPDLSKTMSGLSGNEAVILLDHRPGNAARSAQAGVSLQLSGHTHGGMIRGLDIAAGPVNNGFVSGLYQIGDMTLYVSNGTGLWNGFPLRLGKPSEITLITLRSES
ncbi:MAG: metallophosphoesterase [Silvania sp.]|uniref:metallophosphoesterase n=1 Tax=Silvania sp. TaxID=3016633 RepID=UPI003EE5F74B